MKLSENFTLKELTYTNPEIFKRFGLKNEPNEEVIVSLKNLVVNVLQPLRNHFKVPIIISSGYRSPEYNKVIGGAHGSQHTKGEAVDIDMDGMINQLNIKYKIVTNKEIFDYIIKNLPFDQIIWEFGTNQNPDWVHVSYNKENRKIVTRAIRKNGKVQYQIMPI